jgi:hypothetical protein
MPFQPTAQSVGLGMDRFGIPSMVDSEKSKVSGQQDRVHAAGGDAIGGCDPFYTC